MKVLSSLDGRTVSQLSLDESLYIGSYCSISLWCLYTVLYFSALYLLVRRAGSFMKMTRRTRALTAVCTAQWCLSTVYVAGSISFVTTRGENLGVQWAKVLIETINGALADSLLVWRTWMVWNRDGWILSLLGSLLLATLGASIAMVVEQSSLLRFPDSGAYVMNTASYYSSIAWGACTLVTNIIATGLIIGRILHQKRRLERFAVSSPTAAAYRSIIIIMADSGALYSCSVLATLLALALQSDATFLVFDIQVQLTGIIPVSVIALVALGVTNPDSIDNRGRSVPPISNSQDSWATRADPSAISPDQSRRAQITLALQTSRSAPESTATLPIDPKEFEDDILDSKDV